MRIGAPFSVAVRTVSNTFGPGTDVKSDPIAPTLCHDPQFDQIQAWAGAPLALYGSHGRVVGYQYGDIVKSNGDPRLHTRSGLHLHDTVEQAGRDYPDSRPEGNGYVDDALSLTALYDSTTQRITTVQSGQVCTW